MTRIAIVSGRRLHKGLADFCAFEFEDAIVASCDAELLCPSTSEPTIRCDADVVFVIAIGFGGMMDLLSRIDVPSGIQVVGYVFGAYGRETGLGRTRVTRWMRRRAWRPLQKLTCLYGGIEDDIDVIGERLDIQTRYLPMAANVLLASARPPAELGDRPIAASLIGRQHVPIAAALGDAFNRPGSDRLFYSTNFLRIIGSNDSERYRAMFWQILRQSRVTLAFDQRLAPNPGGAQLSYLGPRWFESLAAGTVLAGHHPDTPDRHRLLDWPDALVDLPEDPSGAVEVLHALTGDLEAVQRISTRNLAEVSRRHDWAHRLAQVFSDLDMQQPENLRKRLETLQRRSDVLLQEDAWAAPMGIAI